MDKRITVALALFCIVLVAGEIYCSTNDGQNYSFEAGLVEGGFECSVGSSASAEFEIILTDNGDRLPVETLYLYYDPDYGTQMNQWDKYTKNMEIKLRSRGMNVIIADTEELAKVISGDSGGVGILISSGAIPDDLQSDLLTWVNNGGTIYWTLGTFGCYGSRADGTTYLLEKNLQEDYFGTTFEQGSGYGEELDGSNPYSSSLQLNNDILWGSLDVSNYSGKTLTMGYHTGKYYEVTFIQSGLGTVCIVSGWHDERCISDAAQVICSGLTLDSTMIDEIACHVHKETITEKIETPSVVGHHYAVYAYVQSLVPVYGNTIYIIPN